MISDFIAYSYSHLLIRQVALLQDKVKEKTIETFWLLYSKLMLKIGQLSGVKVFRFLILEINL